MSMSKITKTDSQLPLTAPYRVPVSEVITLLQSDVAAGLPEDEANRRLQEYGPNQLESKPPVPAWKKFIA